MRLHFDHKKEAIVTQINDRPGKEVPNMDIMGCIVKKEFYLEDNRVNRGLGYRQHLCKVYRRIRWEDPKTKKRKYKDWKIKVIQ